jgi:hypothetical protein
MIDDPSREADALPTLRSRNWLILALLMLGLSGWAIIAAVAWGVWVLECMANAAVIAVGGSV